MPLPDGGMCRCVGATVTGMPVFPSCRSTESTEFRSTEARSQKRADVRYRAGGESSTIGMTIFLFFRKTVKVIFLPG